MRANLKRGNSRKGVYVEGLRCPECRHAKLQKDGTQMSRNRRRQRYVCRHCLRRTIYPKKEK